MAKTRMSSKGQVIIPKAVRDRHGWATGLELEVEDRGDAVVLRPGQALSADDIRRGARLPQV
jgi:AbrB family looped-hinge helix DNA binding protein